MKIRMERIASDDELGTTGIMFIDDEFVGFTIEDEYREEKVDGETRIPAGTYEIKLREEGGLIQKYRARFGDWHKGMLWLQDVQGFKWIYIHAGNTTEHTDGCIIVGYGAMHLPLQAPTVMASRPCYEIIAQIVHEAIASGDTVSIEILDRDR